MAYAAFFRTSSSEPSGSGFRHADLVNLCAFPNGLPRFVRTIEIEELRFIVTVCEDISYLWRKSEAAASYRIGNIVEARISLSYDSCELGKTSLCHPKYDDPIRTYGNV